MAMSTSQLFQHLQTVRTILVADPPDLAQLQQTLHEVASLACGQRDQTSKEFGAEAILNLLQNKYDCKYQPSFAFFEQLGCPPSRLVSTLDAALEHTVATQSGRNCGGGVSSPFPLSESHPGELTRKDVHTYKRTLLTPGNYTAVLDTLFALQISNPLFRNMHLTSKEYLEAEVILDIPSSGQISLWWGPSVSADLLWTSAVWTSKSKSVKRS
jgi:hypothetical protein